MLFHFVLHEEHHLGEYKKIMGWIIPHRWDPLGNSHYHQRRATHPHITTGGFGYKGMASWNFFGFHFFLCVKSWDLHQAWKYRRVWVWRTFSDLSWLRFPATWRVFLRWSWTIARMAAMVASHSRMRWCSWNSPPPLMVSPQGGRRQLHHQPFRRKVPLAAEWIWSLQPSDPGAASLKGSKRMLSKVA